MPRVSCVFVGRDFVFDLSRNSETIMNRLKFILSILTPSALLAQTRLKPTNLDVREPEVTAPINNLKLYGRYGGSFFTEISIGAGLISTLKVVNGAPTIELTALAQPVNLPLELTQQADRVSNNTYSIPITPVLGSRRLKVYNNGLFQTPGVDYTRDGDNAVRFTSIIEDGSVITFVYSGV